MNLTKQYITASDLDSYKDFTIPYGTIGEIVDTRTYLRWLPELNRRETALERWQRVINYNLSLVSTKHRYDYLRSEALLMLDKFVNMKADVSGRTKWVGGTEASSINPQNNFNCSSTVINRITVFAEIFGLLMNGCGVGFRVFSDDISKLPKFDNRFTSMSFEDYDPLPKNAREEYTRSFFLASKLLMIEVGDSKQGWMDALDIYLDVRCSLNVYLKGTEIIFNVDSVRPMGERIKGFGGTASGPEAFKGIIQDIDRILKESPEDQLRSIDCMDVICAIAKGVVAGSSRRSALISLFEQYDNLMTNSKVNLYSDPTLAHKLYRSQSNNTCCLTEEPTLEEIKALLHTCKTEGEPGFNNFSKMVHNRSEAAKKHRPNNPVVWYTDVLTNPCHEISLTAGKTGNAVSFCNLTTLPLPNFVSVHHDGYPDFDWNEFANCLALNTRISMRQTCVEFDNPEWTETQADERLLGVSMTGCQDMFSMMGWKTGSIEIDEFLHFANAVANNEAYRYAKEINIPRPLLVTTTKPEGSSSTIFGTSSGLHWDWAPYYIRRVRMTSKDALALTLLDQGFTAYPELYDLEKAFPDQTLTAWDRIEHFDKFPSATRRALLKECNTIVFEFPVESNSSSTQSEISAREQLESVKAFTNIYCDHMPSSTISVKDDEWDDVANWIKDNWDSYITASFFPYFGAKYPLLPLEAITMEEYQSKLTLIPSESITVLDSGRITFRVNHDLLTAHEQALDKSTDEDLGSDCEKGSCPIR